jgi:hypothetical protein
MERASKRSKPSVTTGAARAAADAAADAAGGRGHGSGGGGAPPPWLPQAAARVARVAERAEIARHLLALLGLVTVGLEAVGWALPLVASLALPLVAPVVGGGLWAPVAMSMVTGAGLEALVDALRLSREAAAVEGGFCDMAAGKPGTWPSWRKNPSFFRWGWPGLGQGGLGANGRVTAGRRGTRPEDADLPMGAKAYTVL